MEVLERVYDIKSYSGTEKNYYEPRKCLGSNIGNFDQHGGSETAQFLYGDENIRDASNTVSSWLNEAERKLDSKVYLVMRTGYTRS